MYTSPYWTYTEFDPIRVQIQLAAIDPAQLGEHLERERERMRRSAASGRRIYLILDARNSERPSPEVRKLQAEWMQTERELIAQSCVGMGFVVPNRVVRGALTAIFWVVDTPVQHQVHADLDEALNHALGVCDGLGLRPPLAARHPQAGAQLELADRRALAHREAL